MISCIASSGQNYEETINTLKYGKLLFLRLYNFLASRATKIKKTIKSKIFEKEL